MLQRVFRSFSQNDPKTVNNQPNQKNKGQDPLLPDLISSRILDLEMQCEKQTISKQCVFELTAQYTKAIEFYEQKGNDKYKLYQKRMQNFLTKPIIVEILKGKSGQMVIKKQKKEACIRKAEDKAQQQAKEFMKKQQEVQKKHQEIVKSQIEKQQEVLEERRRNRRAISNRSANSSLFLEQEQIIVNNEESGKKPKERQQIMEMKDFLINLSEKKRNRNNKQGL